MIRLKTKIIGGLLAVQAGRQRGQLQQFFAFVIHGMTGLNGLVACACQRYWLSTIKR